MTKRIMVQIESLQIGQSPSLRRESFELIVTEVQEKQVRQMYEQCVWNSFNAAMEKCVSELVNRSIEYKLKCFLTDCG